MSVAHVNRHPPCLECKTLRQPPVQRIDIAVNGLYRRHRIEGVEHGPPANVPGMQNLRHAGERVKQAVAQQAMRV